MKYMGGKAKIAKHILPIILKSRQPDQWYVEPFVGGANVIDKVDGNRIGADINKHVICLFQGLQNSFVPPGHVSEAEYKNAQQHRDLTPLTTFIGFPCSYAGKWFGGYARGNTNKGIPRNYCDEGKRALMKQKPFLDGVKFVCSSFIDLDIPDNSIIYCDPSYAGTTSYKDKLHHEMFWIWCDEMVKKGHKVFVSEYKAPDGWECVWEGRVSSSLTKDTGSKKAIERLFTRTKESAMLASDWGSST